MFCAEPRSIWIHCGSEAALDQRVPALPSTARLGVVPAFSLDEEVAVLLSATLFVPQPVEVVDVTVDVKVRVGVRVGPVGVLVRVGVLVTAATVFVRVGVFVAPPLAP